MPMDIKKVVDAAVRFQNDNPSATDDEVKLHAFEYLLSELKQSSVEELLPHFRSLDLKRAERQVVVTLSFPWEITFSNIVYGGAAPETQKRTKTENNGTFKVGVSSFSINQSNNKSEMTLGLYFDDPSNGVDAYSTFFHQLNQMIHEKGWSFPSFKS